MSVRAAMRSGCLGLVLLGLAACGGSTRQDADRDKAIQQAWSPFVWSHTSGVISRHGDIQVRFASDVAPDFPHHSVPAGLVTLVPAVEGTAVFTGPRDLVFHPRAELDRGKSYVVRIAATGLQGVPQNLAPYQFSFDVQSSQFEVSVQGLYSGANDAAGMTLRGTLISADVEDNDKIEHIVAVDYLGKSVPLHWMHQGTSHEFRADGLKRQSQAQQVTVRWDGAPIASSARSSRTLDVPARGVFAVTQAAADDTQGRREIVVTFSDRLAANQNLTGLVRLSAGQFTSRMSGNVLIVYPDTDPQGDLTLTIEPGVRNETGGRLEARFEQVVAFVTTKPQVRFVGSGVILPDGKTLSVPFEAVSARSVHVAAVRIYEDNVSQFLQLNKLDGSLEIGRVGRYLWQKTIPLKGPVTGRWSRYDLDVTELMRKYPGGMFRLVMRLTPADSAYPCAKADGDGAVAQPGTSTPKSQDDGDERMASSWDMVEEWVDPSAGRLNWRDRDDACSPAYFAYAQNVSAQRNLLASNLGLLAKRDQHGKLLVATTDLRTGTPLSGVKLTVRNFQGQTLAAMTSDANGFASASVTGTPFLLVGEANGDRGYLKLSTGMALPTSHFDVGGEKVNGGVKGYIYAERGVWRPGDTMHLVLVLQDKEGTLPASHPVALELYDPRGRLVRTVAGANAMGGFYRFDLQTGTDAPTGDWTAKAILGDLSYSRALKVETVMPNRLKVTLDLGAGMPGSGKPLRGSVSAQWLSGATAAGLKAEVKVALSPTVTRFNRFNDFTFDDPAREFATKIDSLFDGQLDANGQSKFERALDLAGSAPGMLSATFTTRVFEKGGAFSSNRETTTFAPYATFVGLRVPKGDVARDILVTDQEHTVQIATLSADGEPVSAKNLQITLYKVSWRWWWDKSRDSLAQYVQSASTEVVRQDTIATENGTATWKFEIKQPEWGRYLLRVCDKDGGHCAGRTIYVDWPSWAGREREQTGVAASVLTVTTDKPRYTVGDTATIQLPESAQGRALVTIENGTGVLDARWVEPQRGHTRFTVPITAGMAPNAYVAVTLIQPHEGKANDRPIRLYGIVPLEVEDPKTYLRPTLRTADEWKPESRGEIEVAEAGGHEMTYTLAVVDEGLLSLTGFKTPDLHASFYKREALGVTTWDLYDDVIGAYGAQLERLLALGGSDAAAKVDDDEPRSRFPPVVQFLGPFHLNSGAKAIHRVSLPRYIGAVRVMVVAGDKGAYGSAEKSVFVRQPLMLLPTMPRVVGPNEDIAVPVSVFVSDAAIHNVSLDIEPGAYFTADGTTSASLDFTQPEEKLAVLHLKAGNRLGQGRVRFTATSGAQRATAEINIDIRSSAAPVTTFQAAAVKPGETWSSTVTPAGLPGTFSATLEVSGIPSMDLEDRLRYLVQYPHGCLEQTTSSVFPQLYLPSLLQLDEQRKAEIERNIRAGIERLGMFQLSNGGFSYWPQQNGFAAGSLEGYALWATTYASHFLIEAERLGYALPPRMKSDLLRNLRSTADDWSSDNASHGSSLDQAYRLYVLALAGQPEVGAMNRLRETPKLANTERWVLAAAYKRAGLGDLGNSLVSGVAAEESAGRYGAEGDYTFGSSFRDDAMILQSLADLGRLDQSDRLVKSISQRLASQQWYSTQEVSYSLLAMSRVFGVSRSGTITFDRDLGGERASITWSAPVYQAPITGVLPTGKTVSIHNTSSGLLFVTVASRAVPAAGEERPHTAGLAIDVRYTDEQGQSVDVTKLTQGRDLIAHVSVRNATHSRVDNIALTQIFPAGWEIHNDRLDAEGAARAQPVDYTDIRDDRVMQYFGLAPGASIDFDTRLNAAYRGRFYQPAIVAEAMYDAKTSAATGGQWVEVAPAASR